MISPCFNVPMVRLCFVCLGNICRSPTAEGIMRALLERENLLSKVIVDSAGTAAHHVGERADPRTREVAQKRGVSLGSIAREFVASDLQRFDYVLAMDQENYDNLLAMTAKSEERAKVYLFLSFDPESPPGACVPDPYYSGSQGFEEVFDICEAACSGLLTHLRATKQLS